MRGLALTVVWLVGCSGIQKVVKAPPAPLELTSIVVYPVTVNGQETSEARRFELVSRTLGAAVQEAGDALAFFGPTEFRVLKPEAEPSWVANDALPMLVKAGARPDQGAFLRLVVERRVASSSTQTESLKGQARGASASEETTWLVRAELLHPISSTLLLEATGQVVVDPFATPPPEAEWDPAPQLTLLLEKLTRVAVQHAKGHAAVRSAAPAPPAVFAPTPAAAGLGGADEADPLQREIALQNRARVLAPTATESEAGPLSRALPGAAVLVGDGKLTAGDVVLKVDGLPALPHVLARLRFKGAPGELEVKRATGATESVVWP